MIINHDEILNHLQDVILKNKYPKKDITVDTQLISSGIVDSLILVRVISYLEEKYNIEIEDWDITPENFESIQAIGKILEEKYVTQ